MQSRARLKRASITGVILFSTVLLFLPTLLAENPKTSFRKAETTAIHSSEAQASEEDVESRMEEHRQMRREKMKQLTPPKQTVLEKYLYNLDQKIVNPAEDTNSWGFYPKIDWISRGSGAALGVRYWNPDSIGPLDILGSAFYSWRQYQHYDLQLGLIPHLGNSIPHKSFETANVEELGNVDRDRFSRFKLYGRARFRDRADDSFYGYGPDSKQEDRRRYRLKDTLAEGVIGYQFTESLGFTFKTGFVGHSLGCGRSSPDFCEFPPSSDLPGFFTPPNFIRTHTSFLIDLRDNPGVPRKGFMWALGWEKWDNLNTENRYNFNRILLDVRGYIPLGSHQRVIAIRGFFVDSDPAPGNRVPFFLQPSLGGGESLRGYDFFRFQGDKLMLIQAEYRWEASRRFELALFGDTGTVANKRHRVSLDKLKSDWGIGFRFKTSRSTIFRIDQAFSNEGPKTQFRFSAVF